MYRHRPKPRVHQTDNSKGKFETLNSFVMDRPQQAHSRTGYKTKNE